MVTTQFGEDRCTQFRVIVVTDPQTLIQTHTNEEIHRQDRLQYTAPLSLARSVNMALYSRPLQVAEEVFCTVYYRTQSIIAT